MINLLYLAVAMAAGLALSRLMKLVNLPNVTGYLIGGLLIGPSVLNIIPEAAVSGMSVISEAALGFIAFSIGNEFKLEYFKRVGVTPIVIAVFEALFAVVVVFIWLAAAGNNLSFSLSKNLIPVGLFTFLSQ